MNARATWLSGWAGRLLLPQLIKWALVAVIALVLYGALPAGHLATVLGMFFLVRCCFLLAEARRTPMTLQLWQTITGDLIRYYESLPLEQRDTVAAGLGLGAGAPARALAEAHVRNAIRDYVAPRPRLELVAEVLGLVAFAALLPAGTALWTSDFFSLRMPLGWIGAAVAVVSLGLYGWPHFLKRSSKRASWKLLWWGLPFLPLLAIFLGGVSVKHPYLNPFHPEHKRLAAKRVLTLKNIIVAGRHADWVSRYARQLDDEGDRALAIAFYREALRLDPGNREVRTRLAALTGTGVAGSVGATPSSKAAATGPYWAADAVFVTPARCPIDARLGDLGECSVVIVTIGEVPRRVLEAVSHAIRNELRLPVFVSTQSVPLPAHTRVRGLVTGRQWDQDTLVRAFWGCCQPLPMAPVKYLLITPVDMYGEGANYVFSVSYEHWALVALARFGDPKGEGSLLCHRAAKQSLCALLKCFRIPPSPDRECVTSYSRTLEEFDAKGNRPNAETEVRFRQAVSELNRQWLAYKAKR